MIRLRKGVVICLMAVSVSIGTIYAQGGRYIQDVPMSSITKGFAMTGAALGLESGYKNPAGVTTIKSAQMASSYSNLYDGMGQLASIGVGTIAYKKLSLALNVPIKMIPDIPETVNQFGVGKQTGSFADLETAGLLSMGYPINEALSVGVGLKYLVQTVAEDQMTGAGFDVGVMVHRDSFSVGASIQNVGNTVLQWSTGREEVMTQQFNLGASVRMSPSWKLYADGSLASRAPNHVGPEPEPIMNLGTTVILTPILSIEGGIHDLSGAKRWGVGVSLKLDQLTVDYAFAQHDTLGSVQKLGIKVMFE